MKLRYVTLMALMIAISGMGEQLMMAQGLPKLIHNNLVSNRNLSVELSQNLTHEETHQKSQELAQMDTPKLAGQVWKLQQIQYNNNTRLIPGNPANYTIEFLDNGQLAIKADCNRVRGNYNSKENKTLSIELGASTRAACPPGSLDTRYLQALKDTAIYFFKEGNLYLDLKADTGTMKFSSANPKTVKTLTGNVWQLRKIQYQDGTLLVPGSPENYTINFLEDGKIAIKADCNRILGNYTQSNDSLSLKLGPSTLAACLPFSLENEYRQALMMVSGYSLKDEELQINLGTDAGMMFFTRGNEES